MPVDLCPSCGEPTVNDRLNCPKCGAAYPDLEERGFESDPQRQGDDVGTTDQQPQKAGHDDHAVSTEHAHGDVPARHPTHEGTQEADEEAAAEEASRDSFPGSDAPAW